MGSKKILCQWIYEIKDRPIHKVDLYTSTYSILRSPLSSHDSGISYLLSAYSSSRFDAFWLDKKIGNPNFTSGEKTSNQISAFYTWFRRTREITGHYISWLDPFPYDRFCRAHSINQFWLKKILNKNNLIDYRKYFKPTIYLSTNDSTKKAIKSINQTADWSTSFSIHFYTYVMKGFGTNSWIFEIDICISVWDEKKKNKSYSKKTHSYRHTDTHTRTRTHTYLYIYLNHHYHRHQWSFSLIICLYHLLARLLCSIQCPRRADECKIL